MTDRLLLMPEVSEITRISVDSLRWLRQSRGGPPSFKVGKRVMYRESEVQAWIEQQAREDVNAVRAS